MFILKNIRKNLCFLSNIYDLFILEKLELNQSNIILNSIIYQIAQDSGNLR
ncbi:MAG: hypothetical protein BAJALOKI3v1_380035 [Promethearchaeota archaeon]|nr:MAG: hypothetical protein BAJALOKI3v1_380035 [Candidatus Lokiarchaeota archaeon]